MFKNRVNHVTQFWPILVTPPPFILSKPYATLNKRVIHTIFVWLEVVLYGYSFGPADSVFFNTFLSQEKVNPYLRNIACISLVCYKKYNFSPFTRFPIHTGSDHFPIIYQAFICRIMKSFSAVAHQKTRYFARSSTMKASSI